MRKTSQHQTVRRETDQGLQIICYRRADTRKSNITTTVINDTLYLYNSYVCIAVIFSEEMSRRDEKICLFINQGSRVFFVCFCWCMKGKTIKRGRKKSHSQTLIERRQASKCFFNRNQKELVTGGRVGGGKNKK